MIAGTMSRVIGFDSQRRSMVSPVGSTLDRIDTHLNRSGVKRTMKLAEFDDESIRKMGIWLLSSNAFLGCIQQQITGFSQGMETNMIRIVIFSNIEGSSNHTG